MAVKESGNYFKYCSTRLRKNKDLVMEALKLQVVHINMPVANIKIILILHGTC